MGGALDTMKNFFNDSWDTIASYDMALSIGVFYATRIVFLLLEKIVSGIPLYVATAAIGYAIASVLYLLMFWFRAYRLGKTLKEKTLYESLSAAGYVAFPVVLYHLAGLICAGIIPGTGALKDIKPFSVACIAGANNLGVVPWGIGTYFLLFATVFYTTMIK